MAESKVWVRAPARAGEHQQDAVGRVAQLTGGQQDLRRATGVNIGSFQECGSRYERAKGKARVNRTTNMFANSPNWQGRSAPAGGTAGAVTQTPVRVEANGVYWRQTSAPRDERQQKE